MDKKYTPGPWSWDVWHNLDPVFALEMNQGFGALWWTEESNREADKALIASAPDLLEALEEAADPLSGYLYGDVLDRARAAIAKAKGEA